MKHFLFLGLCYGYAMYLKFLDVRLFGFVVVMPIFAFAAWLLVYSKKR